MLVVYIGPGVEFNSWHWQGNRHRHRFLNGKSLDVSLGYYSNGILDVESGGQVISNNVALGDDGGNGTVTINGEGSSLDKF